jgi:hypothetical protein
MTKTRSLYLAVALFTLAVQVAAAGHSPALHEEPVVQCQDQGAHFCPESVDHHTGPCVLCHVSLNGVYLERLDCVDAGLLSEPVGVVDDGAPASDSPLGSHTPRGPPVG